MLALVIRRSMCSMLNTTIRRSSSTLFIRPLSISCVHHQFPNMNKMMDELSKNPKAMALFKAMQKDPRIARSMQDLMMIMIRKGYIDMKNPMKQPNLTMLADGEIRSKLFELIKLLSAAGIFDVKDNANPSESLSKIMRLLIPSLNQSKQIEFNEEKNVKSSPKYDMTYDIKTKETKVNSNNENLSNRGWTEKLKKIFK